MGEDREALNREGGGGAENTGRSIGLVRPEGEEGRSVLDMQEPLWVDGRGGVGVGEKKSLTERTF